MPTNVENSAMATGLEKISFHSNPKERQSQRMLKIALISHISKVMFKILQARLQQYVNHELPDVQAEFRKSRGTRDQIANIHWIIKKEESSRKTSISASLTMPKPLTVWITLVIRNMQIKTTINFTPTRTEINQHRSTVLVRRWNSYMWNTWTPRH